MTEPMGRLATPAQPQYVSLKDAAQRYGVSERTLRRRVAEGTLPAVRFGPRSIRVNLDDVGALARPIPAVGA